MTRNAFALALIATCIVGVLLFPLIEQRTPIGGAQPQILALNR